MSTRESSRPDDGSRRLRVAVEPDASTNVARLRFGEARSRKRGRRARGHTGSDATSLVSASTIAPSVSVIDHRRPFAGARLRIGQCADTPGGLAGSPIAAIRLGVCVDIAEGGSGVEALGPARAHGGGGGRRGRPAGQPAEPHRVVVSGCRSPQVDLAAGGRGARIGVDGQFCAHAVPAAESGNGQGRSSSGAGHRVCRQRPVGHAAVGRFADEPGVCLPPVQAAGSGGDGRRLDVGRGRGDLLVGVGAPAGGGGHPDRQRLRRRHRRRGRDRGGRPVRRGDHGHSTSRRADRPAATGGVDAAADLACARPARPATPTPCSPVWPPAWDHCACRPRDGRRWW